MGLRIHGRAALAARHEQPQQQQGEGRHAHGASAHATEGEIEQQQQHAAEQQPRGAVAEPHARAARLRRAGLGQDRAVVERRQGRGRRIAVRAAGRGSDVAQRAGVEPADHLAAVRPAHEGAAVGDLGAARAAEAERVDGDAVGAQRVEHGGGLAAAEVLAVAQHEDRAGAFSAGERLVGRAQCRGQVGAAARDVPRTRERCHLGERRAVLRARHEQARLAREEHQREPVATGGFGERGDLRLGTREAVRGHVAGEHAARDVQAHDEVHALEGRAPHRAAGEQHEDREHHEGNAEQVRDAGEHGGHGRTRNQDARRTPPSSSSASASSANGRRRSART